MIKNSHQNRDSRVLTTFAAVLTLFIAGCATISSGSHINETADFSNYRTYAWAFDSPFVRGEVNSDIPISALTQTKIESAIELELANKGFTKTTYSTEADLLISYTVGTREKLVRERYPNYYRGDWAGHVNHGYYYGTEVVEHSYTKGTLGVDVFDKESGEPVWHGWAEKTITSDDRQDPTDSISNGVRLLLENFPYSSQ